MPFKQMENIAVFLKGIAELPGIRSFDLFMTVDLFEGKNLEQVKRCLAAWKRTADKIGVDLRRGSVTETPAAPEIKIESTAESIDEEQTPFTESSITTEDNNQQQQQQQQQTSFNAHSSSVSESGFEASRSTSYHSLEPADPSDAITVDDSETLAETNESVITESTQDDDETVIIEQKVADIEISYVEPEIIMPPESPIENNFADIDEPVIECVADC